MIETLYVAYSFKARHWIWIIGSEYLRLDPSRYGNPEKIFGYNIFGSTEHVMTTGQYFQG